MNRIIGLGFFITANIYLAYFYVIDIVKYYSGTFNYDGIRYLIPLAIADLLFLIALPFIFFYVGLNKRFLLFLILAGMQNLTVGFGVERMPFVGALTVIATFVYMIWLEINRVQKH